MFELHYRTAAWLLEVKIDATMLWTIIHLICFLGEYLLNNIPQ